MQRYALKPLFQLKKKKPNVNYYYYSYRTISNNVYGDVRLSIGARFICALFLLLFVYIVFKQFSN